MSDPSTSPVLVFDGDCGFCTKSAQWLTRRGGAEAHPAHSLDLTDAERARTLDAAGWMVDGRVRAWGAAAIAAALRHRGGAYATLGALLLLPGLRGLAEIVYGWVARHRHRMPGATDQCRLEPTPAVRPWRRRLLAGAVAVQILVPAVALTHPPSRLGFQMFSGLGRTSVTVLDRDGERLPLPSGLLPALLRPDLPYAATLPEFLCERMPEATRVTVRDMDDERSIRC